MIKKNTRLQNQTPTHYWDFKKIIQKKKLNLLDLRTKSTIQTYGQHKV
jgi:hypothetical protein